MACLFVSSNHLPDAPSSLPLRTRSQRAQIGESTFDAFQLDRRVKLWYVVLECYRSTARLNGIVCSLLYSRPALKLLDFGHIA